MRTSDRVIMWLREMPYNTVTVGTLQAGSHSNRVKPESRRDVKSYRASADALHKLCK